MAHRILVVEDDDVIAGLLVDALTTDGYLVTRLADYTGSRQEISADCYDLALLDLALPDGDGLTLCRELRRRRREMPIILVTARDTEIDIVVGLDAGANDYVVKPFSIRVLLARVRAHLRPLTDEDPHAALTVGAVRVDPVARMVSVDGTAVELRRREYDLLVFLAREAGRAVTRERLLAEVWGVSWQTSSKTLEMHILALRQKLGSALEITTLRGVGYRLESS